MGLTERRPIPTEACLRISRTSLFTLRFTEFENQHTYGKEQLTLFCKVENTLEA